MSTALLLGAAVIQPALGQTVMSDASVSLSASCANLDTPEGRKSCQGAFELFANTLKERQIEAVASPRYVSFGEVDNPVTVLVQQPLPESYPTIIALNGACHNIAMKRPHEKNSERLDDGSDVGLLRMAERARHCADVAQSVSEATKAPFMFAIASAIRQNADRVIPQVNKLPYILASLSLRPAPDAGVR